MKTQFNLRTEYNPLINSWFYGDQVNLVIVDRRLKTSRSREILSKDFALIEIELKYKYIVFILLVLYLYLRYIVFRLVLIFNKLRIMVIYFMTMLLT